MSIDGFLLAVAFIGAGATAAATGADAPASVAAAASAGAADAAGAAPPAGKGGTDGAGDTPQLQTITVTAQRLNEERLGIETQTGASTYTIDNQGIVAQPGGGNQSLSDVLLQAPDVVQDSFGQLHVRGDHNGLQYRLNGVILPEGISVFSQTLSPRLISSVSLITGALPAEYGLRTAGVIDLSSNSGLLQPGGYVSLYGGSFGTIQPSFEYGGSSGGLSYYVTGDYKQSDVGIESPDGSAVPLHDQTRQIHGFGYLEKILDPNNRLSLILGISDGKYQIPNQRGLQPTLGLDVNGITGFLSDDLDENQRELAEYAIVSWQHAAGALNFETSLAVRYTSLHFSPDWLGDLLYNGNAQDAFKDDSAVSWQTDAAYTLADAHTVRFGFFLQHDSSASTTGSQVLAVDMNGVQTSNVPLVIPDNGTQAQEIESVYLQDEWRVFEPLTLNYGLRFDHYSAYSNGSLLQPRINFVWKLGSDTTVHGGYSRYFIPPPFELIGATTISKFIGTTAEPAILQDTAPFGERDNYYDVGVQRRLLDNTFTLGVDSFYKQSQHLIDEGQFGAPIILTPFNYRYGLIGGVEFTANYSISNFSAYGNVSFQAAHGKEWESAQFNFDPADFAYVAQDYIHLDHEGRVAASGGVSYLWQGTRLSADFIFGTGLRQDLVLTDGTTIPNGDHTPSYTQVNLGLSHDFHLSGSSLLSARFDVINALDKVYVIRSGTGIGVFAPQYGPRRGLFAGLAWQF
ncbi:MAG TPA: TonB-dependent receptor [Steroidobacteraceae bacterium]|nr:TonB-dependent receptor [Steroidobacteraceae bacterium]